MRSSRVAERLRSQPVAICIGERFVKQKVITTNHATAGQDGRDGHTYNTTSFFQITVVMNTCATKISWSFMTTRICELA